MEVGDYVRTEYGIDKIGGYRYNKGYEYCHLLWLDKSDCEDIYTDDNLPKSSPNIIDLIEVGDYVNGSKVVRIEEHDEELYVYVQETEYCNACNEEENIYYKENTIKSIVTKEQFENMEYKIEE